MADAEQWSAEQGSATAELAVAFPAVVLGLAAVLGVGQVALAQLSCVDAARAGARVAARGETTTRVLQAARQSVDGTAVQVSLSRGPLVTVVVRHPVRFLGLTITTVARAQAEPEQPADGGSATVLVLAAVLLAVLAAVTVGGVAVATTARHQAAAAADLAALAGAGAAVPAGGGLPCAEAARVARANLATLERCTVRAEQVRVWVRVRPIGAVGRLGVARASAVAGPADSPGPVDQGSR